MLFSGTDSENLWKKIDKLRNKKKKRKKYRKMAAGVAYLIACRCQELEHRVRDLECDLGRVFREYTPTPTTATQSKTEGGGT